MKILNTIGPRFDSAAKKVLERVGEVSYRILSQDEFTYAVEDYEALVIGLGLRVDKKIIDTASRLKLIATATTGLDHIDVSYAEEKGITVLSLRSEDLKAVTGTAELAFALILSLTRRVPEALDAVRSGNWEREKFLGNNLSGKTLGIVGLGRLGSLMAQYGRTFGMRVIAYDPYQDASDSAQLVDFNTLLAKSDVVSIHAPLSSETTNMFNEEVLSRMKQGAFLINTARSPIVNEAEVLIALKNKKIAGYAADVLSGENEFGKDVSKHPLIAYAQDHRNLIITPHIGGYTAESRATTDVIIAKKVYETLYES